MSFLDKLKKLIEIKGLKVDLNIFHDIASHNLKIENFNLHIHLDNKSQTPIPISQVDNKITINPDKLPEIRAIIKENYEEFSAIISSDDYKKLEEIENTDNIDRYSKLKGIISDNDYDILKASVVIKERFKNKQEIQHLKDELVENHGPRARKISNLCSAGYFDAIMELFDNLIKEKSFNTETFRRLCDVMIEEEAFSIFVHVGLNPNLKEIILNKLKRNKSYGINYVNIHALNKSNVNLANKAVREILKEHNEIEIEEKNDTNTSLFVRLKYTSSEEII